MSTPPLEPRPAPLTAEEVRERVLRLMTTLGTYADPGQHIRVRFRGEILVCEIAEDGGKHIPPLDEAFLTKARAAQKACQRGVGGREALELAHGIMADCYGLLGRFLLHAVGPK